MSGTQEVAYMVTCARAPTLAYSSAYPPKGVGETFNVWFALVCILACVGCCLCCAGSGLLLSALAGLICFMLHSWIRLSVFAWLSETINSHLYNYSWVRSYEQHINVHACKSTNTQLRMCQTRCRTIQLRGDVTIESIQTYERTSVHRQ